MNYFLKNHSRLFALLLAVCLVATMFTGCQRKEPQDTAPSTEEGLPGGLVEVKPTETETLPPETTEPENDNMATVTDQLNVRSSPSTGAKIIGYLDPGTEVEIIKTETYMGVEWALIREGWIVLDYVEMNNGSDIGNKTEDPSEPTEPQATEPANTTSIKGTVTSNGLNIRKEPNTTSTIVGNYKSGANITILETKNGWGRTDKGWVSMTYVSTNGNTTANNNNTNNNTTNNTTANTTKDGSTYFITASELNIRDSASVNGNKVGTYVRGDKVVVSETKDGWGKTDKGWVSMKYVNMGTGGNTTYKVGKATVNVNTNLNIRKEAKADSESLGYYVNGDVVNILEVANTYWGKVEYKTGEYGWISLQYVKY